MTSPYGFPFTEIEAMLDKFGLEPVEKVILVLLFMTVFIILIILQPTEEAMKE